VQKFNAAGVAEALKKLPAEPAGKTPLVKSLNELETVLKGLSGKTFVYGDNRVITDGLIPSLRVKLSSLSEFVRAIKITGMKPGIIPLKFREHTFS
jgi:hypothetical protein